jgi:hypothetical protein
MFNTKDKARTLLEHLLQAGEFAPQYFGGLPPLHKRFVRENLDEAVSLLVNRAKQELTPATPSGELWVERRTRPEMSTCRIAWIRGPYTPFSSPWYHIDAAYMQEPAHLEAWLDLCRSLLEFHDAWFAAICLDDEWDDHNYLTYKKRQLPDWPQGYDAGHSVGTELQEGIPGVYWGTYFGSFYVDWFGRDRFDTLPCVKKQELSRGGILFTTALTPFEWNKPETRATQRAVMNHLGADAFFDMQALRAKMSTIGEPFPEDLDPRELVPTHKVPEFPFADEMKVPEKSREEKIEQTRRYFEHYGFVFEGIEKDELVFRDSDGELVRVNLAEKKIDHWPKP